MNWYSLGALTLGLLVTGLGPLAAQEDCKPVFDAQDKVMATPTHIYSTSKVGNAVKDTAEAIYAGDSLYSLTKGKWVLSPVKMEQLVKQNEADRKKTVTVCAHLKDESINGVMAAIYSVKTATTGQKTEGQLAIAKDNGLPLTNEVDSYTGEKASKMHYSVKYEYKNVEPPAVEKP
jgi:hypothetical protein